MRFIDLKRVSGRKHFQSTQNISRFSPASRTTGYREPEFVTTNTFHNERFMSLPRPRDCTRGAPCPLRVSPVATGGAATCQRRGCEAADRARPGSTWMRINDSTGAAARTPVPLSARSVSLPRRWRRRRLGCSRPRL